VVPVIKYASQSFSRRIQCLLKKAQPGQLFVVANLKTISLFSQVRTSLLQNKVVLL
jgi:hypothetical protein